MQIRRENIDLMVPVGSYESLIAAIQGGADSVYFGLGRMNMRARSSINFNDKDLDKIIRTCRHFNKKVYVALNIVFYNNELDQMKKTIDLAKEKGVNALIISDQSAIQYAHEVGMEIHLSTQLNISNIESLKFYSKFADVAVLARELTLMQVKDIINQINEQKITGPNGNLMKIELFAHGAMCMSISGKCYLSLHHYNYSANRGECLQDCRRSYTVQDKETGFELEIDNEYILSPKDLCTIHFLNKIIDAGVNVLKIEGRARSPEYVKVVTQCYDQALKSLSEGSYSKDKIEAWKVRLSTVFNRGFWDGFYLGQKLGEWNDVYGSKATTKKVYIAKNINYFNNINVADFLCEADNLKIGDKVLIIGPSTGVIEHTIEEIRIDDKNEKSAKPGDRFSIPIITKIRRADKMYKIVKASKTAK